MLKRGRLDSALSSGSRLICTYSMMIYASGGQCYFKLLIFLNIRWGLTGNQPVQSEWSGSLQKPCVSKGKTDRSLE